MRAINPDTGEVLVLADGQWVPEKPQRAVNPDTGEALVLTDGRWVPEKPYGVGQALADVGAGALRGAGSIGATLLSPLDAAARALNEGQPWNVGGYDILGQDRRKGMDEGLASMGANPESWPYTIGKFGAEVAGTAGVGGALGQGAARVGLPQLAAALETGGLAGGTLANRVGGGALAGGAAGGLIDPSLAGVGIGAGLGGALGGLANAGARVFGGVAPARRQLALDAEQAGVSVPVDRILQNRILDRTAGALEYLPFSGRANALQNMEEQIRTAANRTMGQGGADVRGSVTAARAALGPQFDEIAGQAIIPDTPALRQKLMDQAEEITSTLSPTDSGPLLGQIRYLEDQFDTGGFLPGRAALTMKTRLDAMSKSGGTVGHQARQLRGVLLDEIGTALGPADAANYTALRSQWNNMKHMEKLQTHDAEGAISMARLGNMPQQNATRDMTRVADIASNFARTRDSSHSLQQQNLLTGLAGAVGAGSIGMLPQAAAAIAGGRGLNAALNSDWLRRLVLDQAQQGIIGPSILALRNAAYRAGPGAVASSLD